MPKLILIFFFILLTDFSALSNCPNSREIWLSFQKVKNQSELIQLKNICQKCNIRDSTYANILQEIAKIYHGKQDFLAATLLVQEAIALNSSHQKNINKSNLVDNFNLLAKIKDGQGNYQEALIIYNRCIELSANFPEKIIIQPYIYAQKASILSRKGDFEQAIAQANIGINLAQQGGQDSLITKCLIERAKAYVLMGDVTKANKDLETAKNNLKKEKFSDSLPKAFYFFAQTASKEKKYLEAISFYEQAQQMYFRSKNEDKYALSFVDIGINYYFLKQYDKALENYQKGLKIMKRPFMKVIFFDDIAAVYWMKKDYPKAFENYQKALSVAPIGFNAKTLFDNPTVNNLKGADFKTYFLTTLQDKAETWLEYYEKTKEPKHLQIALNTYLTADKLIDLMRFEHSGTQSKLYWRNKTHHLYEQAIKTCFLLKNYDKAFYFFEKSKAILLNDRLNELTAKQQLSPQDLAKEVDFQQKILELNKKLSSELENSKKYADFQSQLIEVQANQERFIKGLETKNPTYFRYKYDTTLVTLEKVKKYLSSDQTLLEYFVGDEAIYALQISNHKTDLYKISNEKYKEKAQLFLSYCADNQKANRDYKDFLLVSNQLYQQIFRYINIPKGRLIIAQDGFFLPFEALSKSAKKAEYLLNDYAISYTYSVQFLLKNLSESSFSVGHKFMGMSPVNFNHNLNQTSLLGSDISLSDIASNFFFGKKYNQTEATKKAFLNNAHDYQIVHLYTHAQADSTDQEPMIYFKDSVLKLSELSNLERFKTQLLVLSACKTAVGKNAVGEGILSLSRGFAALGIPATLTTLWSVENQATYTLNELFYRYLSQGYSKDISLQKAKLEFLQSQSGEKQLPTFWAAAVLVGDAEAITFNKFWVYLLIGFILISGGFWWYQKK
ncbi:CHAT domain-containing protein [Arcicella aurantiaca]|uniref:CHAT domain-containing protein n=1 Tax=Arcicella aurantiaca TaxID=591202 RepID=A0A316E0X6_9BACT|nr:CHAT domain-containing protein [Arcicella aurantiaca]PWK23338.1 CHAT domain-containing protein [Arcicella aurantiaca]